MRLKQTQFYVKVVVFHKLRISENSKVDFEWKMIFNYLVIFCCFCFSPFTVR